MDEVLKRRLVGTAILLLLALGITALLPRPEPEKPAEGETLVTIDLNAPPAAMPGETVQAPATPVPETLAVAAAAPADGPVDAAPVTDPAPAPAAPAPAETEPLPSPAEPKPAAAAAKPQLKMESALASAKPKTAPPTEKKPPEAPPSAAAAAKPAPPKAQDAPKPAPSPGPVWYVQVASFNDVDKARLEAERFKALGMKTLISPADTPKGTWYRVRLGPYGAKEEAEKARGKVAAQGAPQATVVSG